MGSTTFAGFVLSASLTGALSGCSFLDASGIEAAQASSISAAEATSDATEVRLAALT
jgi:hypothetical protein